MSIPEKLDELRILKNKVQKLINKIAYCGEQSISIPTPRWDIDRVDKTRNLRVPFEYWLMKKADYEDELKKVEDELEKKKLEVTELITDLIDDENTLMVILFRDVSFKSYEFIASKLDIFISYVYKLHKQGMEMINKITS